LIEKETELAKHQTGNNSGVIHSGIYYKPGSLKATNCIQGYHMLVAFCRQYEIPFELCGKIIVASNASELSLTPESIHARPAKRIAELKEPYPGGTKEYEPHVTGLGGIFVPQTGMWTTRTLPGSMAN